MVWEMKRFEGYERIGGLFEGSVKGGMEVWVREGIWEVMVEIVGVMGEVLWGDEEEIMRMIGYENGKMKMIKDLWGVKKRG